jgi:hypothetical protein
VRRATASSKQSAVCRRRAGLARIDTWDEMLLALRSGDFGGMEFFSDALRLMH